MTKAKYIHYTLRFIRPGGTSRGVLTEKDSWFIEIMDENGSKGTGEVGFLKGLSVDDVNELENVLRSVTENPSSIDYKKLVRFPAIRFAVEQAELDLKNGGKGIYFKSDFTAGKKAIRINGLIWMGERDYMRQQVKEKLIKGFHCLKLKIGAIDFNDELELLKSIRKEFTRSDIELRVDANGAFHPAEAMEKLQLLAGQDLHSIEQPIMAGQWEALKTLCKNTPLPIALDEELIGVNNENEKRLLIETIQPQYIILKPSLLGGIASCEEWIRIAENNNAGWWITSALESNIGLNAIAQWTATLNTDLPQGLGTGQLYYNNFKSPLQLNGDKLNYNPSLRRETPFEN